VKPPLTPAVEVLENANNPGERVVTLEWLRHAESKSTVGPVVVFENWAQVTEVIELLIRAGIDVWGPIPDDTMRTMRPPTEH